MQATISKWGNSLALRLPRHVADKVRLVEGSTVDVEVDDKGAITLTPCRKKFALADLLEGEPKRKTVSDNHEYDWGKSTGDEEW